MYSITLRVQIWFDSTWLDHKWCKLMLTMSVIQIWYTFRLWGDATMAYLNLFLKWTTKVCLVSSIRFANLNSVPFLLVIAYTNHFNIQQLKTCMHEFTWLQRLWTNNPTLHLAACKAHEHSQLTMIRFTQAWVHSPDVGCYCRLPIVIFTLIRIHNKKFCSWEKCELSWALAISTILLLQFSTQSICWCCFLNQIDCPSILIICHQRPAFTLAHVVLHAYRFFDLHFAWNSDREQRPASRALQLEGKLTVCFFLTQLALLHTKAVLTKH